MRYPAVASDFFIQNRKRLSEKLNTGSVALQFSNFQMPRNGDQFYPYRQHSDLFYLTGIEQEKTILLLAPDNPNNALKEILFILRADKKLEIWEGHKLTPEEASAISGIKTVKYLDEFQLNLHQQILNVQHIFLNIPENPKFIPEVKTQDEVIAEQLRQKYPLHTFERLAPLLQSLRLLKSKTEIDLIQKAINITGQAFQSVLKTVKPGIMEYEIEALIAYEFIRRGAAGHAYAPIVATGKNACALHYIENDRNCAEGDLLLMDFGAEYANYSADLSRTIPVNGRFTRRQRDLYDATLRVFEFAKTQIKPGITINTFHAEVCKLWEEEHLQLGLYTTQDIKAHKGENPLWYSYYMHGTSHFMGLDVHDPGTRELILQPGMVITCEPAIYIEKEGVGIRIENDVLITETSCEDLMADIPVEAREIEELMASR